MEILDIKQEHDILYLFFKEGEDLQKIIDLQKEKEDNDEATDFHYCEIAIQENYTFLGKKYICIELRFDGEDETAKTEYYRLVKKYI